MTSSQLKNLCRKRRTIFAWEKKLFLPFSVTWTGIFFCARCAVLRGAIRVSLSLSVHSSVPRVEGFCPLGSVWGGLWPENCHHVTPALETVQNCFLAHQNYRERKITSSSCLVGITDPEIAQQVDFSFILDITRHEETRLFGRLSAQGDLPLFHLPFICFFQHPSLVAEKSLSWSAGFSLW